MNNNIVISFFKALNPLFHAVRSDCIFLYIANVAHMFCFLISETTCWLDMIYCRQRFSANITCTSSLLYSRIKILQSAHFSQGPNVINNEILYSGLKGFYASLSIAADLCPN